MKKKDNLEADFRELVLRSVNTGEYRSEYPWGSFLKIFNLFRKRKGLPRYLTQKQYDFWTMVYIDILDKAKIKIDEENTFIKYFRKKAKKKKKTIVTSAMRRGAYGHQKFHEVRTD